jgi:ABC-type branched-subunit amino acid transport system permease subunit
MTVTASDSRRPELVALFAPRRTASLAERETPIIGSGTQLLATIVVVLVAMLVARSASYLALLVSVGSAYLISATGYSLLLGFSGQFNFGFVGYLAVGAYVFGVGEAAGYGQWISGLIAVVVSALFGAAIGLVTFRTRNFYLALVTLAAAEAIGLGIELWPPAKGDTGLPITFATPQSAPYVAVVIAGLSLIATDRIMRGRFGRKLALIRYDEQLAVAFGVKIVPTKCIINALTAMLGGLGGIVLAGALAYITPPNFTIQLTIMLLTMIVLGGLGTMWGPVLGVIVISIVSEQTNSLGTWQEIIFGLILFAIVVVVPRGLIRAISPRAWGVARERLTRIVAPLRGREMS